MESVFRRADDVTRTMSKGGGVLVNVQGGGVFQIPGGRVDDVTRTMSKGGVLVNVQEGGVFQFPGGWMTSRGQCPRGGIYNIYSVYEQLFIFPALPGFSLPCCCILSHGTVH